MTQTRTSLRLALALGLLCAGAAQAGSLTAPATPDDPSSAMFTLEDIYQRLDSGAPGALRTGPFAEPTAGPGSTGHTLNDVMAKAPALDDAAGAAAGEVASGKTFWGLKAGAWGPQSGTMPQIGAQAITPGPAAQAISQGYHDGTGSVAGDADLAAGNIKQGVDLFGVVGTYPLAGVPKTGQTICYNASGAVISCTGTGQDGDLQKGVPWPSPRFTDNTNGTVTDNLTGLIWLKNANCFGKRTWEQALGNANSLANGQCGLTDGSTAGQWGLPNVRQQQSLIDYNRISPALPAGHPFSGVENLVYWSSTTYPGRAAYAWFVSLGSGYVSDNLKTSTNYVWPVRGGQ
jgi:hypothetical protein